jgi:hypothetical protein
VYDTAVVVAADDPDVGVDELISSQTCQQRRKDDGAVPLSPVVAAWGTVVGVDGGNQLGDRMSGIAFRKGLGHFRATDEWHRIGD